MLKKALSILLALLLVLIPAIVGGEEKEPQQLTNAEGFVYVLADDGTAEIVDYIGMSENLIIPETLDGHLVTIIRQKAFSSASFNEVTVADSIRIIGPSAFEHCTNLTTARLPEGLEVMWDNVFWHCGKLVSVNLPDTLKQFGDAVFSGCEALDSVTMTAVHPLLELVDGVLFSRENRRLLWYPMQKKDQTYSVPEGTLSIGKYAFFNSALTSVSIPDSVEEILMGAFTRSFSLQRFNIPPKVTELESVLAECRSLTDIKVSPDNPVFYDIDGVLFHREDQKLVLYPAGRKEEHYQIPEGTLIIGSDAFDNAALTEIIIPGFVKKIEYNAFLFSKLKSVTISEGVEEFGNCPFQHCYKLTEIRLPRSLVKLGINPFIYCNALSTVIVDEDHPALAIMNDALVCVEDMRLVWYPQTANTEKYEIPEGVRFIDDDAFEHCTQLTEITLPEGVEMIGFGAFAGCANLRRIVLPASLKEIKNNALSMEYNSQELIPAVYVVLKGSYAENYCQTYGLTIEYAH